MKQTPILIIVLLSLFITVSASNLNGQFDKKLVPFTESHKKVVFEHFGGNPLRTEEEFDSSTHVTSARLMNPAAGSSVKAMLVEEKDSDPYIYVDIDSNNRASANEKFVLKKSLEDNPFLWETTVDLPVRNSFFSTSPIFIQYFKSVRYEKMSEKDRLVTQSTQAFARGSVDVNGKKILVQYEYDFSDKKIDPESGWLGVDTNMDGEIDMDGLSPEAARANQEKIVFRVGDTYISTKKANLDKNQIVLKTHKAKDYKRIELGIGKVLPDFSFTDLSGKKRRLSDFRGKYILLDFWGYWCPPCLEEIPYLREAYKRFKNRNFEILGMNTDRNYTPKSIKENLLKNQIRWTQAQRKSFEDMMDFKLRIETFPTTFLLSPEGKILSMNRTDRGEPDLRGNDLLKSLDKILPE